MGIRLAMWEQSWRCGHMAGRRGNKPGDVGIRLMTWV